MPLTDLSCTVGGGMHRMMDISVPSEVADTLLTQLERRERVLVHVLNRGADGVLRLVAQATPEYSIVTAETSSSIDPKLDPLVERDIDEALWEELETGVRHQGRTTPNILALMALGGVLGCFDLTTEEAPQATALTAASIVVPTSSRSPRWRLA